MPAVAGKEFLIQVDISAVMTTIAGQRGGTLNIEADQIDVSTKDSGGWGAVIQGPQRWSIDFDALVIQDDASYQEMIDAFDGGTLLTVQFLREDGKVFKGQAVLTSFTHDIPYDDAASYSGTLSGYGQPSKFFETP